MNVSTILQNILLKIEPFLMQLYCRYRYAASPNLREDRNIEYSWVVANLPEGTERALDFGCGTSYLALTAAQRGAKTTAIDLTPIHWFYIHPNLNFIQKDIFDSGFAPETFDLIINCSTVEHIGIVGRYGIRKSHPGGDIEAMAEMRKLLKPEGKMLLTIPIGQDIIFPPLHRVYGKRRLPKLLDGYIVKKEEYWIKNDKNQWILTEKLKAFDLAPNRNFYGLGCFILQAKNGKSRKTD